MINLKILENLENRSSADIFENISNVITIKFPGRHPTTPKGTTITFAVYVADGPDCLADHFAGREEKEFYGPTTISLALDNPLPAEKIQALKTILEERINKIKTENITYFIEIVDLVCSKLPAEFGVKANSSYVPD